MGVVEDLRSARLARRQTQAAVGRASGLTQSAIARVETTGSATIETVERYADALGVRIGVLGDVGPTMPALGCRVADALRGPSPPDSALREVIGFVDAMRTRPSVEIAAAIRPEPHRVGDSRWDAMLAATAEHVCLQAGAPVPGWTAAPSRFLDQWWFPMSDIVGFLPKGLAVYAVSHSPGPFAVRGIMIDPSTLDSV